jgi:hypothetical protein
VGEVDDGYNWGVTEDVAAARERKDRIPASHPTYFIFLFHLFLILISIYREMYVRTVNSGQHLTLQILDIVGTTEVPAGLQNIPTLNG